MKLDGTSMYIVNCRTLEKEQEKNSDNILLSKVFAIKIPRENNRAESIAGAFSRGMSEMTDKMLQDIKAAVLESIADN